MVPDPATISREEFDDFLSQYQPLLESVSVEKSARNGQKSLVELDQYRYVEAPKHFRLDMPERAMGHDDVKALVEWKLRHGKFRPMLMKLVTSNDASTVTRVVGDALQTYRDTSDSSAAVDILTKLKGIGPATASLLLSVHDPERVLFFSDEAFYWLCCGGKRDAIKYNKKEYAALGEEAQKLIERLGVRAVDLEKVAYVVMNQTAGGFDTKDDKKDSPEDQVTRRDLSKNSSTARSQSEKRKRDPGEKKVVAAPLRRSKRTRHSVEEQG
ncbi:hypothetical protein VUR80DRAFT_616 [Thermomyces stellatus]